MKKSVKKVVDWRKRTKLRMIESMGGGCQICSYNKCPSGLAFHHIDPSQKELGFGATRANIKGWPKIAEELRKCILVCHNCHSEIHEGITELPENYAKFDERFYDYKNM